MPWGGLRIVPKSPWLGLINRFLQCVFTKNITGRYPRKKEKSLRGGLKSRHQTSPTKFSNGIALRELELNICNASGYNEAIRVAP